jgi:replicative DNA helicase
LEKIGGKEYLEEVYSTDVAASNWQYYSEKAKELLYARKTLEIAAELTQAALDPSAAQQLPAMINDALAKISGFHESKAETKPIKDVVLRRLSYYENAMNNPGQVDGLTTGIPQLDRAIRGLRAGNMLVISAPTKGGKTTLALNIAANTAKAGNPVGIFSMEMNEGEIADKLLSAEGEIDISSLAFAGPNKFIADRLRNAAGVIGRSPIFLRDESLLNTIQFRSAARKLVAQHGCKLLLVDYVQLMDPTNSKDSRERQVADSSRTIKTTAAELGIPIIVMAQLNDDGRSRESRAIEQDANIFIKIERPKDDKGNDDKEAGHDHYNIRIVLARDCACATIPMTFTKEYSKFSQKEHGG